MTLHSESDECLKEWIGSVVNKEAKRMAKKGSPSCLAKTDSDSLLQLSNQMIADELKEKASIMHTVLRSAIVTPRQNKKILNGESKDRSISAIAMASSVILKKRCSNLSAQAFRVGFILHFSGAKKMVNI